MRRWFIRTNVEQYYGTQRKFLASKIPPSVGNEICASVALKSVHLWQLILINNHKIIGMSTIKVFSRNDLEQINNADDLEISPFREDGKTYGTPTWIWNVVIEDNLYVRAYNGIHSR